MASPLVVEYFFTTPAIPTRGGIFFTTPAKPFVGKTCDLHRNWDVPFVTHGEIFFPPLVASPLVGEKTRPHFSSEQVWYKHADNVTDSALNLTEIVIRWKCELKINSVRPRALLKCKSNNNPLSDLDDSYYVSLNFPII